MPNARTHDLITVVTAIGANVAYFRFASAPDLTLAALFTGTYLFAGYACAGDLDLNSAEYRRWGPLRFVWYPYRQLVPHRSWVSHGLIMGGVIRVAYLLVVCALLLWGGLWVYHHLIAPVDANAVTQRHLASLLDFAREKPHQSGALLSGFILAGTTHSVSDTISTWFKRRF
jgi:uncharacterized metal-binding protein